MEDCQLRWGFNEWLHNQSRAKKIDHFLTRYLLILSKEFGNKSVCGANEVDKIDWSKIEYFLRVSVCGKIF